MHSQDMYVAFLYIYICTYHGHFFKSNYIYVLRFRCQYLQLRSRIHFHCILAYFSHHTSPVFVEYAVKILHKTLRIIIHIGMYILCVYVTSHDNNH